MPSILIIIWIVISTIFTLMIWINHRKDRFLKKAFWSLVVWIPLAGWLFYGGLYNPLNSGPTKSGDGDSGVGAQSGY